MILREFKRYWKSKLNIAIFVIMSAFIVTSFLSNVHERNEQFQNIEMGLSLGHDVADSLFQYEAMQGGLYHFERLFFLHTGMLFFMLVVFIIGVGINACGKSFLALKTGYGINMMIRMPYSSYLKKTLIAQGLYVASFLFTFFVITLLGLIVFDGGMIEISKLSAVAFHGEMSMLLYLLILLGIVFYIIVCKVLLILIASLSYVFLKNVYLIQFAPVGFFVGAYVFAFMFGNLTHGMSIVARALIFEHSLVSLSGLFSWQTDGSIAFTVFQPLFLLIIFITFYKLNVTKFGKDYL